jgi:hypothetical protein
MKPLFSPTVAAVFAAIGAGVAAVSAVVPAPWGTIVGIVGFLAAGLGGASVAAPSITEGKPLLQGAALTVGTSALALLAQFYAVIPTGWPQSVAMALGALMAWATGKAMPALGAPSPAVLEAAKTDGEAAAAAVASKKAALDAINSAKPTPPLP